MRAHIEREREKERERERWRPENICFTSPKERQIDGEIDRQRDKQQEVELITR